MRINREQNREQIGFVLLVMVAAAFPFIPLFSQEATYAFGDGHRDPLAPLVDKNGVILIQQEVEVGGMTLTGIIYSPAAPLAVINDEVLAEGDDIAGYTVLDITERTVQLQKGNEGFTLKLEEE